MEYLSPDSTPPPFLLYHPILGRDETDVVVKVFAKHDPSLKLEAHEKKLCG